MCWRHFISRIHTFHINCQFASVKLATEWSDKQLPAIERQSVLWNLSEETRWLGHRHWVRCHVYLTSGWDTYCCWAVAVTRSILTASTLAKAKNRMNNERCVYVVETHSGVSMSCQALQCLWLVHKAASVKAALHSGETLLTGLIKCAMCCDSNSKTLISNMTQIRNPFFLDINWLSRFSLLKNVFKKVISTAVLFVSSYAGFFSFNYLY